jgi:hypothetical protein
MVSVLPSSVVDCGFKTKLKTIKLVFSTSLLSTQHYFIKEKDQRLVVSESG